MGLTAKAKPQIPPIKEGTYFAVCSGVIDLGHHKSKKYPKNPPRHKVLIVVEIPEERIKITTEDGTEKDVPKVLSREFGLCLGTKCSLRKVVSSFRGKQFTDAELESFELKTLLGLSCQIEVVHSKSTDGQITYANIGNYMAMPKGAPALKCEMDYWFFSFEDSYNVPDELPEWIHKKIKGNPEKDYSPCVEWEQHLKTLNKPKAQPGEDDLVYSVPSSLPAETQTLMDVPAQSVNPEDKIPF